MKSKLEVYALAVCFASVVCLVISVSTAVYSVVQIANPELTMYSFKYDKYQTNERFWESTQPYSKDKAQAKPSEQELTKMREDAFRREIGTERREGFQGLIKAFIFILVGTITLVVHWQIARRARMDKA